VLIRKVKQSFNSLMKTCRLISVAPKTPSLTLSPSSATVDRSTFVTLTCQTASAGTTTYKFIKDGSQQVSQESTTYNIIAAATHTGSWTCTATIDSVNSSASSAHSLTVHGRWQPAGEPGLRDPQHSS